MSTPREENSPNLDDVIDPQEDALPQSTRTGNGKMPETVDDDDLQAAAEQERVAAGCRTTRRARCRRQQIRCRRKPPTRPTVPSAA
jgi:hypothetical protein